MLRFDSNALTKFKILAIDKIDFERFTKNLLLFVDMTLMFQIDCSRFKIKNLSLTFNFESISDSLLIDFEKLSKSLSFEFDEILNKCVVEIILLFVDMMLTF